MLIGQREFNSFLEVLRGQQFFALDTETTGLNPYLKDELFSISIATAENTYYLNFQYYPDVAQNFILTRDYIFRLRDLFHSLGEPRVIFMHNAVFDLAFLHKEKALPSCTVWCTKVMARILYNEHLSYSLAACVPRIGFKKDDSVEKYIDEHKLWEWEVIPGKKTRNKKKFFHKVPFEIISKYALQDAFVTYKLGMSQMDELKRLSNGNKVGLPPLSNIAESETRLIRTVLKMERSGLRIDRNYCMQATRFEAERAKSTAQNFVAQTGRVFSASSNLFASVFESEKNKWKYTEKGNPSFDSDILATFANPAAKLVLQYRDAKSKLDFYGGFLYHADSEDRVHPTFNQSATRTGRFGSASPNFQNITAEEDETNGYKVRRAIIPSPGNALVSFDYDQMEYRLMLEYAQELELIKKINAGMDVHMATAQMMGTDRKKAKCINFLTIYGGGSQILADTLGVSLSEAIRLKSLYFAALPRVQNFIKEVQYKASLRGFITNWAGRIYQFPDSNMAYKAPNTLIQGGCADIIKIAMNQIDELIASENLTMRMIATVHDELLFDVPKNEFHHLATIKFRMEHAYSAKLLPLTVGVEYSYRSWGDMLSGMPDAGHTGDTFQKEVSDTVSAHA